jgi:putative hydrolase of the HAD superfamily
VTNSADGTNASGRTLVWDLGGVVLRWEPVELVREALAHLLPGAPDGANAVEGRDVGVPALTSRLFGDFAAGGFWEEFDRGVLGRDEVAGHMAASSGLDVAEVLRVLDQVGPHLALRPETVTLVGRVRAAGHRVVYLSNMPGPYADDLDALLDPLFDGGVFSCRVHEAKPEPQIFRLAEQLLDLDPDDLLFLDDREPNVDAAREYGWPAALFTDAASCTTRLAADGWL